MINNPKISVCIPTYNREEYISQCIESVILQDYQNIEIIISDNYSTDKTADIIKGFLSDRRIRFYQNDSNLGMYRNTEIAMNYSTGDYIAFLSSDDYWNDKTYLSQAVDKINNLKDIVVFCGGKKVLNEQSKTLYDLSDDTDGLFDGSEIFLKGLDAWPPFEMGAMVIKANLLKRIMSDIEYHYHADDVYIFWRLCLQGKLYILRKPFLIFRNHDGNTCRWKSVDDFINRILCNAIVPIKTYEIAVKKNMFPKQILDKWLIKNIILFILASYLWGWDKFDILKNAYENVLVEKEFSLADFGIEALFNRLHKINVLENKIYYPEENIQIEEIIDFDNLDNGNYSAVRSHICIPYQCENKDIKDIANNDDALRKIIIDLLKNDMDQIGYIKYDAAIKTNLIKVGIKENSIRDFFDVFIYSKIYLYPPEEFQSLNFSTGGIGVLEQINGSMSKIFNVGSDNADIFCRGWIISGIDKISPDRIYAALSKDGQLKYIIEAKLQHRPDVAAMLALKSAENCGYYFVIPADAILSGEYNIITILIKGNDALVFDNNKKIIF